MGYSRAERQRGGRSAGSRLYFQEENDQVDHQHCNEADEPEFHVFHLR